MTEKANDETYGGGLVPVANGVLSSVHRSADCHGQEWGCWVHDPRPHPLADAPIVWRDDKGIAERRCEHGIGHPDPQDAEYNWRVLGRDVTVHACDGCCGPSPERHR